LMRWQIWNNMLRAQPLFVWWGRAEVHEAGKTGNFSSGNVPTHRKEAFVEIRGVRGERISGGEAEDIASQLPDELAEPLTRAGGDPEGFGLDEFYRRVAEKEGIDVDKATEHVSAVMTALGQASRRSLGTTYR